MRFNYIKLIIKVFFIIVFANPSYSNDYLKIDLSKSFIKIYSDTYLWRSNIQSILISENNTYYLLKEVVAEQMGERPFYNSHAHMFMAVVDKESVRVFRSKPVSEFKKNLFLTNMRSEKIISKSMTKNMKLNEVYEALHSSQSINIYCSIKYVFEEKKYNLISPCDYINFSYKNKNFFIQPALGYVPFVSGVEENNINYGYVAINIGEKVGKLEFILNDTGPIFTVYDSDNFIKSFLKKLLNYLTFFKTKNSLSKIISIDDAELSFFKYIH